MTNTINREALHAQFCEKLGGAMAAWSFVETMLCTYFQRITQMQPAMARKVFYSVSGFDGRRRMLKSVIEHVTFEAPVIKEFLNKALNKAGNWTFTRNRMAHGDVVFVSSPNMRFAEQWIILEGSSSVIGDIQEDEAINQEHLDIAKENFGRLAMCLGVALNTTADQLTARCEELLQLVQQLPTVAHTTRLDPSVLARFQFDGEYPLHR